MTKSDLDIMYNNSHNEQNIKHEKKGIFKKIQNDKINDTSKINNV